MRSLLPSAFSMRILPHLQDSGGFFVAVFRKKASVEQCAPADRVETELEAEPQLHSSASSSSTQLAPAKKKKCSFFGFRESPFEFLSADEPIWLSIQYGAGSSFSANALRA